VNSISETFPKVGRPPKFSRKWVDYMRGILRGRSVRNAQNFHYLCRAQKLIESHAELAPLADIDHNKRLTVLAALGRIDDDDKLIDVARGIVHFDMTTAQGLELIRRVRSEVAA
jgi:hypothetical protein